MVGLANQYAMNKTALVGIVVVLVVVVGVVAVLAYYRPKPSPGSSTPNGGYYPITVRDGLGRNVTVKSQPTRIVSVCGGNTEDLVALGLGKEIVGVEDFSIWVLTYLNATGYLPSNVTVLNTDSYGYVNVSGVIALHPDIFIGCVGGFQLDQLQLLEGAGITTFVENDTSAAGFRGIEQYLLTLGKIFDRNTQAEELVAWMNQKIDEFKESGNTTVAWAWVNPDHTFYTVGNHTFVDQVISLAGGVNVFASKYSGYPGPLPPSSLVLANPQVLLLSAFNVSYTRAIVESMPGINYVSAYQNNRVYILDENLPDILLDEPGPSSVYAIPMIEAMINGVAPNYVTSEWVMSTFNVTLPVFYT